jgi:hypothetical protein
MICVLSQRLNQLALRWLWLWPRIRRITRIFDSLTTNLLDFATLWPRIFLMTRIFRKGIVIK